MQKRSSQGKSNGPNVRADVITRLENFAPGDSGLLLLESTPNSGASTLLLHFAEGLFLRADAPLPVYFSLRHGESSVLAAKRFAYEFLAQTIAYRRSDPIFSKTSPGFNEILGLAPATDISWIKQAAERIEEESAIDPTSIERCLSVPMLSASSGLRPLLIFDDLHLSSSIDGGDEFVRCLFRVAERAEFPVIAAGRRRYLSRFDGERLSLSSPTFESVRDGVSLSAETIDLKLDDALLDLVAIQIGDRPGFISSLLKRAKQFDGTLSGFPLIQRAYLEEIFTGAIGRWFEREIGYACKDMREEIKVKELFGDLGIQNTAAAPIASLSYSTGISEERLFDIANRLYGSEVVEFSGGELRVPDADPLLADLFQAQGRRSNKKEEHSVVFTTMLAAAVRRAPQLLSEHYRNGSALGLRGLIEKFGRRSMPKALFDQQLFNIRYKGRAKEEIIAELAKDADSVELPSVIFAGNLDSISKEIGKFLIQSVYDRVFQAF
ncbi:hypothetical protein [Leptolyngbya sp. 7M]|uniref:hypothetical protein n=1 Tax=Leptolyngbya sp. 7M TaxID=2812896 RepID=UPI001B8C5090|nr:hypothetical protein [Leptolyngbya sp. 7M]